jgi:hypothetical protein
VPPPQRRAANPEEDQMTSKRKVGNLLALAVLSYLSQQPMHPYELGRSLREHGDDRSIKFNHGSLYMVIGQLASVVAVLRSLTSRPPGSGRCVLCGRAHNQLVSD